MLIQDLPKFVSFRANWISPPSSAKHSPPEPCGVRSGSRRGPASPAPPPPNPATPNPPTPNPPPPQPPPPPPRPREAKALRAAAAELTANARLHRLALAMQATDGATGRRTGRLRGFGGFWGWWVWGGVGAWKPRVHVATMNPRKKKKNNTLKEGGCNIDPKCPPHGLGTGSHGWVGLNVGVGTPRRVQDL